MTWHLREGIGELLGICSVDTEEHNWEPRRDGITSHNIRELPRLRDLLGALDVPVTYFVTHAVASHDASCRVLRDVVHHGQGEVGAHLHPWNTPPLTESLSATNLMLNNLPGRLQESKLQVLTHRLRDVFGETPTVFRAGRSGLGPSTLEAIHRAGYTVDSSVTPFSDLRDIHGPRFTGAPNRAYCIGPDRSPVKPYDVGAILEIPLSSAYSRAPYERWHALHQRLGSRVGRALRLPGLAARTGLVRKISLRPELESTDDMLQLALGLLRQGASHLNVMWHSPSLLPGCSPFVRTEAERDRLLGRIRGFVDALRQSAPVHFVTLSQAAHRLARWTPDQQPVNPDAA